MEEDKMIHLAVRAGELMMINGAETYRTENTMEHIIKKHHPKGIGVNATPTSIFASITDKNGNSHAAVRNIRHRATSLERVSAINELSRAYVRDDCSSKEMGEELEKIATLSSYPYWMVLLGDGIIAGGCVLLDKGFIGDAAIAFLIGLTVAFLKSKYNPHIDGIFLKVTFSAFLLAILAQFFVAIGLAISLDSIIIACIMTLIPGSASVNALRDLFTGDYASGAARALEALLLAGAIVLGAGLSFPLSDFILGLFLKGGA